MESAETETPPISVAVQCRALQIFEARVGEQEPLRFTAPQLSQPRFYIALAPFDNARLRYTKVNNF
jgi:hypothetical protein